MRAERSWWDIFVKVIYGATNTMFALSLIAWPMIALLSMMMFDAPGSEDNTLTLLLAWSIWLYPVPILIGTIGSLVSLIVKARLSILTAFTLVNFMAPTGILVCLSLVEIINDGRFV